MSESTLPTVPQWGSNILAGESGYGVPTYPEPPPPSPPPEPPAEPEGPDPSLFVSTAYTRYNASGRILNHGVMGLGIIQQLRITEGRILVGAEGDPDKEWVDDEDGQPTLETRPTLDLPETLEAAPGIETSIPDLPACEISFSGPLVGTHRHEGGEVHIGFTVPGTYTLTMEPFPHRRATVTVEVKS